MDEKVLKASCCEIAVKLSDISQSTHGTVVDQLNAIVTTLGEIQTSLEAEKQAR